MKTESEKIKTAIEIFKAKFPNAKGKFRAALSDLNGNVVDFFNEAGWDCSINIQSGMIRGI